jgi:hypothetical protein
VRSLKEPRYVRRHTLLSVALAATCSSLDTKSRASQRGSVMANLFRRKSKTEAQAFFEGTYPFPVTAVAVASLLAANFAVTLAAVAATG